MIRSEDTFLTGYVIFDKQPEWAKVAVVEQARTFLEQKLTNGEFELPVGASYRFAGSYVNQLRAQKQLSLILPLSLFVIFLILYFQFKSVPTIALVFTGIFVVGAGGFVMLWLYGQSWFLDLSILGINLREILNIRSYNLSVAVWVGFLALFGIATDDNVLITTYLDQSIAKTAPKTIEEIRMATIAAGQKHHSGALSMESCALGVAAKV